MKRLVLWTLLTLLLSPVFAIQVWQKSNNWLDINFTSESEFAHSFIVEREYSELLYTHNSLALDMRSVNLKMGMCDYRTKRFIEPQSGVDALDYYLTNEHQAVYSDLSVYLQPSMRAIFSIKYSSVNQSPPYYDKLSTPVVKLTLLRQFPWGRSLVSLEGAYSTNLLKNEVTQTASKYIGIANSVADETVIYKTPDLFDVSLHHYKAAITYYSNIKRSFNPLPDKLPLVCTPNNTFIFKTAFDYYQDESVGSLGQSGKSNIQKLSADFNYRFWRVFEISAHGKALDTQIDYSWADNITYDGTASFTGYLYDFDELKLMPAVSYRHIESQNTAQEQVLRLDRLLTFTAYGSLKVIKNVLINGFVSEDVMLNWYRNEAFPQSARIDYGKHSHILNAALGVTVWY